MYFTSSTSFRSGLALRDTVFGVPSRHTSPTSNCFDNLPLRSQNRSLLRNEKYFGSQCVLPARASTSARALLPDPLFPMMATISKLRGTLLLNQPSSVPGSLMLRIWTSFMYRVGLPRTSSNFGGMRPMYTRSSGSLTICRSPSKVGSALIQQYLFVGFD